MKERPESKRIYEEACRHIPQGVNSPVRAFPGLDRTPLVVESGKGSIIRDADGNSYLDFCMSWGSLLHGHAHPKIVERVCEQVAKGSSFGITTEIEGRLAERVLGLVKSMEKVRFVNSGTEATMTAGRLARGYTGRDYLVKFIGNYHGHADFYLVQAGSGCATFHGGASSAGIPADAVKHSLCLPYNDVEAVKKLFADPQYEGKIAGVILEPMAGNMGCVPASQEFVTTLREETKKAGSLLIYDEVITGFRVAKGGAQEVQNIDPDLTCLGKVVGGGFPVAALGGKREIMDFLSPQGPVYQAGTLSGNPVAMASGLAALDLLDQEGFYEELESKTRFLTKEFKAFIEAEDLQACVQEACGLFSIFFGKKEVKNMDDAQACNQEVFKDYFQALFDQGIYLPPSQFEGYFLSAAHSQEDLEKARDAILKQLEGIALDRKELLLTI